MGECLSLSLPQEELAELLEITQFRKEDVKRWYKKFMKDYPEGQLNKEHFNELYGRIYNTNYSNHMAEHIFRSFDHNQDGVISFRELMVSLSVASHGTMREKLESAFNVYDLDGNGQVTLEEVRHVVKCIQGSSRRRGTGFMTSQGGMDSDEITDMFEMVDSDSNGYWTLEEFIEGMQVNPTFVKMLQTAPIPNKPVQGGAR